MFIRRKHSFLLISAGIIIGGEVGLGLTGGVTRLSGIEL